MSAPDLCEGCLAEREWCLCGVVASMRPACCRCGRPGPRLVFDDRAPGWFCGDSRECILRIGRRRRNQSSPYRPSGGAAPDRIDTAAGHDPGDEHEEIP